jgi:hypothetical protein
MLHIPRSTAIQALFWCDQLEAEISLGQKEEVVEKLQGMFQGWLDDFKEVDALVALQAIRAYANQVLEEEHEDPEGT